MIVNNELIKKVRGHFDLNIYETKVWLALISRGVATAREVADISGVPRSRTYDVLESLEKQGFAISKVGKPVKFISVKPIIVLERLKNGIIKGAEEKTKFLSDLKDTQEYKELEQLHSKSFELIKKEDLSGAIKGKNEIYMQMKEILESAKKEVLVCISAEELLRNSRTFKRLFKKLKEKGIKINLYLNGSEEEITKSRQFYNIKAEKTDVKGKFFVVDREQILVSLNKTDNKENELAVWLNSSFFAPALVQLFNGMGKV